MICRSEVVGRPSLCVPMRSSRTHFAPFPFLKPASSRAPFCSLSARDLAPPPLDVDPNRSSRPLEIVASPTGVSKVLLDGLPMLKQLYKPYPLLRNRHQETIFAALLRFCPQVMFKRECLRMQDNGSVALDWPVGGADCEMGPDYCTDEGSPVLILLPGLTGGSDDTYVRHLLVRAWKCGWNVVVFNSRGCADSPVTSPQADVESKSPDFTSEWDVALSFAGFL